MEPTGQKRLPVVVYTRLQSVVKEIQDAFGEILNPESQADFNNPELLNAYPELSVFSNFMENSLGIFNLPLILSLEIPFLADTLLFNIVVLLTNWEL